ncbi:Intraflagellar transport protein 20 like protein [Aduncisulcus paluster]|uniref:Intraflagellar transport protein 20 like protein n=1 Tax=Aduncisulcus paluster TaxID=2918883 RepID=A0ABQ5K753_9EUKA|nr:Intraflagellar transport protein 20 like protein [Aduncisulcus paluster]
MEGTDLFFDEQQKIRILDPTIASEIQKLKQLTSSFILKSRDFVSVSSTIISSMKQIAHATEVERLKAIGLKLQLEKERSESSERILELKERIKNRREQLSKLETEEKSLTNLVQHQSEEIQHDQTVSIRLEGCFEFCLSQFWMGDKKDQEKDVDKIDEAMKILTTQGADDEDWDIDVSKLPEYCGDWQTHPLFSSETTDDIKELLAESTPGEQAETFKDQGNHVIKLAVRMMKEITDLTEDDKQRKFNQLYCGDWQTHPLFSSETTDDIKELLAESTPGEQAETFKDQGNHVIKLAVRMMKEITDLTEDDKQRKFNQLVENAIVYYVKAIKLENPDKIQMSSYFSNIAYAHILVNNYKYAVKDCTLALKYNPHNKKALFRAATSYFHLRNFETAISFVSIYEKLEQSEEIDVPNKKIQQLKSKIMKELSIIREKKLKLEREREERISKQRDLWTVLKKNDITIGTEISHFPVSRMPTNPSGGKGFWLNGRDIHFPLLLVYPIHGQIEIFSDLTLDVTVHSVLATILETFPPWDEEKLYSADSVYVCFMYGWCEEIDISSGNLLDRPTDLKWLSVKISLTMKQVFAHEKYICPQIPILYILPKGKRESMEFLKSKTL